MRRSRQTRSFAVKYPGNTFRTEDEQRSDRLKMYFLVNKDIDYRLKSKGYYRPLFNRISYAQKPYAVEHAKVLLRNKKLDAIVQQYNDGFGAYYQVWVKKK